MRDVDRKTVDIMDLTPGDALTLVSRQFPKMTRRNGMFEVVVWEGRPWIGAGLRKEEWYGARTAYSIMDRENCWSAPLDDVRIRYHCLWVERARVPKDFVAFIALMV